MKNMKKVIAIVLTVVMLLSAMVMSAVAYTQGDAATTKVNFKFEVCQVPKVVMDSTNNAEATDGAYNAINNDIYAVTIFIKSAYGVDGVLMPCMYNAEHFDLLSYVEGDDATNSGAYIGFDSSEPNGHSYVWGLGKGWQDTGSYNAAGAPATGKQAKCFGLANASAAKVWPSITMMNSVQGDWAEWTAGISDTSKTGVIKVYINDVGKGKNAFLNVYEGKIVNDYIDIVTLYFIRKASVAEEDCYGDVFGIVGTDKREPDASGFISGATSQTVALESGATDGIAYGSSNIVNAAVEASIKPLAALTANNAKAQQIAFNSATSVDYRFVAQFSTTAFPIDYNTSTYKINSTSIEEVGFLIARSGNNYPLSTYTSKSAADITSIVNSTEPTAINRVTTNKISCGTAGGAAFAFSARITGITITDTATGAPQSEYDAVPYVISGGVAYFGAEVLHSDIQGRYLTYHEAALGA